MLRFLPWCLTRRKYSPRYLRQAFVKIDRSMVCGKLYLNRTVSISTLAKESSLTKEAVRQCLQRRGLSFTQYVDSFRIQEAVIRIAQMGRGDRNLTSVAHNCGFTSLRSLNYRCVKTLGVSAWVLLQRHIDATRNTGPGLRPPE